MSTGLRLTPILSLFPPSSLPLASVFMSDGSPLLDKLRLARRAEKSSAPYLSPGHLSALSFLLHTLLVVLHVFLVVVWAQGAEKRAVFSTTMQTTASLVITASTTSFGTVYYAILVYLTQKLAIRRTLQRKQTLTASHDTISAWSGMGAAAQQLWNQQRIFAAPFALFGVFSYLAGILVLHISTPALFSVEIFTAEYQQQLTTTGFPIFNVTTFNESDLMTKGRIVVDAFWTGQTSLYYLPFATDVTTRGWAAGSLYDLPDPGSAVGNATVPAHGFNVTCGSIPDLATNSTDGNFTISTGGITYTLPATDMTIISTLLIQEQRLTSFPDLIFYSTMPIFDSENNTLPTTIVPGFPNAAVQFFRCSLNIVQQTAVVDVQSQKLADAPVSDITKTSATWVPLTSDPVMDLLAPVFNFDFCGLMTPEMWTWCYNTYSQEKPPTPDYLWLKEPYALANMWKLWYYNTPPSLWWRNQAAASSVASAIAQTYMSTADVQVPALLHFLGIGYLSIGKGPTLQLHQVENALASVVSGLLWTAVHAPIQGSYATLGQTRMRTVSLAVGNTTASVPQTQARLNLSPVATFAGLVASLLLLGLILPGVPLIVASDTGPGEISGTGLLQVIWMYRDHRKLQELLEHVDIPTERNLREAGMVGVQLVDGANAVNGGKNRRRRGGQSAEFHSGAYSFWQE
ncbi:hypothetical protein B0H16DRAFT_1720211 [Mycena metata]|uniref:Uncharacterized protein n=1 Tax=Mycena metata TaxID=1033252 RepID=A0AAD7NGM1_9AGAR|nr:hypothetical protein B0H16DRAFT_1720211 [Mycena metata]